jgi:hypothetical protein
LSGAVVFTGPTLPAAHVGALLPAIVLPPARQGDVWRAVQAHRPRAIGLIDGVFLHEPAVWHRELLWAMDQGVHVFGAASMGALRAAELAAFGMRGVGRVFQAFLDGQWPGFPEPFEDDDEVAVTHAPAELGAAALSDAMVDLRDTLLAAEAAGVLAAADRMRLAAALKQLPFPERSFARLVGLAAEHADFTAWLPGGRVARKRRDAERMLRELALFLATDPPPLQPAFHFQHPQVWADFLTEAALPLEPAEALALDELRLDPAAWHAATRAALGRHCALAAAPAPPAGSARAQMTAFRHARGLARRADLDGWLEDNAATSPRLAQLLAEEAALAAALADPPADLPAAILAHLRWSGAFPALLRRARAAQSALAGQSPQPGELERAMAWHADRLQKAAGWASDTHELSTTARGTSFSMAVWRAYKLALSGDA